MPSMNITNTADPQAKPSLVLLLYGDGGVGKTTCASTAPKPLLADCENGTKYLGLRGIKLDVAHIEKWADMREFLEVAKGAQYETVIIDPLDELMDKVKKAMIASGDAKLVQKDGSPTMGGWGWMKKQFKDYIKALRDTGKHVILIAHVQEEKDEERIVKRPKIETKISADIIGMVDVVAYMAVVGRGDEAKRILMVDPESDKYVAKDRTGQLGKVVEPNIQKIINACQGSETYAWSKKVEAQAAPVAVATPAQATPAPATVADKVKAASAKK